MLVGTMMAAPISPNDRTRWLEILELAAESQPDTIDDHWRWLMQELGVPLVHFHEVLVAVAEGRWRKAQNPRAYVKTVARRLAQKQQAKAASIEGPRVHLGDTPSHRDNFSFEEAVDSIYTHSSAEPTKCADGIWRRGEGNYDDEHYDDDGVPLSAISYRERMLGRVPNNLKELVAPSQQQRAAIDRINELFMDTHIDLGPRLEVRWEEWANAAGLDKWEYEVMVCKLNQKSRDEALADQATEEDRKALQAAWRRFDRTGLRKLQETAKKFIEKRPEMTRHRH